MKRTLKAIVATRKQVEAEAREGKKCHNWSPDKGDCVYYENQRYNKPKKRRSK